MQLLTLSLNNVRQLNGPYRFYPGFNLLVGENGAGKTTLLRAILTVVGPSKNKFKLTTDDIKHRELFFDITATTRVSNETIEATIRQHRWEPVRHNRLNPATAVLFYPSTEASCASLTGKKIRRYHAGRSDPMKEAESFFYREEMRETRAASNGVRFGTSRSIRPFVRRILSVFSDTFSDFSWVFEPYSCSIQISRNDKLELEPKLRKQITHAIMQHLQEERSYRPSFNWPDRTSITVNAEGFWIDETQKERVRLIPPLEELLYKAKIESDSVRLLRHCAIEFRLTPRIMIRRENMILPLHQLSDGEQRLFSLIADIARNLSLQEVEEQIPHRSAVVLIDEIDVHLHPKWQRKIVPSLEDLFPNCQFIATTHSPFVIQAVDRRKILLPDSRRHLVHDDQNNSIEDIIEDIQGVDLPQRSLRAERLSEAAEKYFGLLNAKRPSPQALRDAEIEYRNASEPYTLEPAAHALLKLAQMEARK